MSEIRLVIREADRDWSGDIHASCADAAVAALSADPVTLDELERAVGRFQARRDDWRYFGNLRPGLRDEPYDAGLVIIDLAARLIVVESTYSSPGPEGEIAWHDGRCSTDIVLRYHLADDWRFLHDSIAWKLTAEHSRRQRAANPPRDVRPIFYGRPLLEFLARGVFAAFPQREEIAAAARAKASEEAREWLAREGGIHPDDVDPALLTDEDVSRFAGESPYYDTLKDIHAAWLLTPRDDLGGLSPRDVVFQNGEHLKWDMQHRWEHWALLHHCPPGLDESSLAYRTAGFGTHELVIYYEFVRAALWSCWNSLEHLHQADPTGATTLTVGDFLANELSRLAAECEAWLDTPEREYHGRTPRSMIHRERRRIPETISGKETIHDPDCPCCQMLADMPGPCFWGLDGSQMDDEFAFDMSCGTRKEWDETQRKDAEWMQQCDAQSKERERMGLSRFVEDDGTPSVWSTKFSVGESTDLPLGVRLFSIGCDLAEVIVDLRRTPGDEEIPPRNRSWIDQLNRDFGNLREILGSTEASLAASLFDPVTSRFAETLAEVGSAHPKLSAKCEALADEVRGLLDPPEEPPEWDAGEDDVPF